MRSALTYFSFIFLFFCLQVEAIAQGNTIQEKLDSLQKANNLADWINERIDYAGKSPTQRLPFLLQTQQKAWRKPKSFQEHYSWLSLLSTQGYSYLQQGNILASIDSYENAFAYYKKYQIADFEIEEYTLKPLSNNYTRLGDYERALFLQKLSVNFMLQTQGKPSDIVAVYGNMAICYQSMGNIAEAEKTVYKGLRVAIAHRVDKISLNNILADILFDKKEYHKATKLIEANIKRQKNVNNKENVPWLISSYTIAGKVYTVQNQYPKADGYFAKAQLLLDRFYKNSKIRDRANLTIHRGHIKLLQQNPLLALQFFNQTLSTLAIKDNNGTLIASHIYGDNRVMEVFEQMATAYQQLKQPALAIKYIRLSLLAGDKIRNEFASDQTKQRLQADLKNIAERGMEIGYQLYQQNKEKAVLNEVLALAEQSKSRTLLDQIKRNQQLMAINQKDSLFMKKRNLEMAIAFNEKQELEGIKQTAQNTEKLKYDLSLIDKQIKQKYQQFNMGNVLLSPSETVAKLPNKRIIEYFVGEDAIYLIDISNGQVSSVVRLPNAKGIKSAIQTYVNTYFQQGPNAMINSPKAFHQASYQIYHTILEDIQLRKHETITIIPDGILGYISFDGLITNNKFSPNISSWPFLIKNNTITYAFSLQTLIANHPKTEQTGFTGFFITHQQNNNAPLKAVQAEADGIKKLVNGQFLFNEQVSSKVFQNEFGKNRVLHIGTHAYLSGKNQEPTLDFGKEKLFLFELAAQKQAPSLVVLSACRTADGLLANGEGVISLSRGFNAIGTSATIAGLWNVNDLAASVITSNFYKHLLKGESNGQALHQAKLEWLQMPQNSDAFYLPYYWDSLIYMGTDEQIDLAQPFNWIWVAGIGGLILCLAVGLVWLWRRLTT